MSYSGYDHHRSGSYDDGSNGTSYEGYAGYVTAGYGAATGGPWPTASREDYYAAASASGGGWGSGGSGGGVSNIPFVSGSSNITANDTSDYSHNPFLAPSGPRPSKHPKDLPVHSRLFVSHSREVTESQLRDAFQVFGTIQDLNMVKRKDPMTKHLTPSGVSFIKFAKATQAAKAIDDLHGKQISGSPKPLKIMLAMSSNGDEVPDEEQLRIFIKIPSGYDDDRVKDHFKQFGSVEYFNIPKDKCTDRPKGFGYVKYFRFYDAALAVEDADPEYKAVFAEARPPKGPSMTPSSGGGGGGGGSTQGFVKAGQAPPMGSDYGPPPPPPPPMQQSSLMALPDNIMNPNIRSEATTCLKIMCDRSVDERQLTLLCDFIPGFKRCDTVSSGTFQATFTTVGWAQYALEKLSGFEYPPSNRLLVKFVPDPNSVKRENNAVVDYSALAAAAYPAGPPPSGGPGGDDNPFYPCDVPLPPIQPMVDRLPTDTGYAARLFIVCHPCALAQAVLRNAFCRFGDLIDVYTLPNKNYGFAKFAKADSADECKRTLNRANVAGCNLKVVSAEDEKEPRDPNSASKRRRT